MGTGTGACPRQLLLTENLSCGFADLFLYSLDVTSTECFYFATEFEVTANLLIVEDSVTIYDSQRGTCPFADFVGFELQIGSMGNGQYQRGGAFYCGRQIVLNADIYKVGLIAEESCP